MEATHKIIGGTFNGHQATNVQNVEGFPVWKKVTVIFPDHTTKQNVDVLAANLKPLPGGHRDQS